MIYQLLLAGFDKETDETDHLVKWIKAPTEFAVELFARNLGLQEGYEIEDTMFGMFGEDDVGFGDGVDIEIDESGEIVRTEHEINVETWKEQHNDYCQGR